MKKKVIILQHGGGELANQLWNFASIYSYCLEKNYDCQNYSFFEYSQYFNIPIDNYLINFVFFNRFKNHHKRRSHVKNKFWRFVYKIYEKLTIKFHKDRIISSVNSENKNTYLLSDSNTKLKHLENDDKPIYFIGWLFRNPDGLFKFRSEIIKFFKPKDIYTLSVTKKITELKKKYKNIVGIHLRQGDYKIFKNGEYLISQERVSKIMDEYLKFTNKQSSETVFIFTSDGKTQNQLFSNFNFEISDKNAIEDIYLLSLCDVIIGSNSSFGNFAAFYGDIPHIIMDKKAIDWDYYKDKNNYFLNKYCTLANL